jgi:hypothetical protein
MCWKTEGGRGDSWCFMRLRKEVRWTAWWCYALEDGGWKRGFLVLYAAEEGSEMECLVVLCAGRRREEEGFLVLYAVEEGSEMG